MNIIIKVLKLKTAEHTRWQNTFFQGTVIAGSALGLGTLAVGLYFELIKGMRKKDNEKDVRKTEQESEAA